MPKRKACDVSRRLISDEMDALVLIPVEQRMDALVLDSVVECAFCQRVLGAEQATWPSSGACAHVICAGCYEVWNQTFSHCTQCWMPR